MNLVMASVLLLAAVACQLTVIYGAKAGTGLGSATVASNVHNNRNHNINNNGNHNSGGHNTHRNAKAIGKTKRSHLHASNTSAAAARLVMSLASGDVLVRPARGANNDDKAEISNVPTSVLTAATATATASGNGKGNGSSNGSGNGSANGNANVAGNGKGNGAGNGGGSSKRSKSNKKLDKRTTTVNGGASENGAATSGRRHPQDKKYSAASGTAEAANQQQQPHHGNGNGNGNGRNKQRQTLKSQQQQQQQHHGAGKRAGGAKAKSERVEKTATAEKSQSTCRYAKSAWTECDPKTNVRSRTLTLKKGDNCPATRTMQKKCRKTCRYEKGAWSECTNGQMTRQDKLKSASATAAGTGAGATAAAPNDASCEPFRMLNKKCGGGNTKHQQPGGKSNKERKHKDKASRRTSQQA